MVHMQNIRILNIGKIIVRDMFRMGSLCRIYILWRSYGLWNYLSVCCRFNRLPLAYRSILRIGYIYIYTVLHMHFHMSYDLTMCLTFFL